MARWRQAIELAMTDEEIGRLAAIARSRSEAGESGGAGANAARLPREPLVLCGGAKTWRSIIRRSNAASSGRWPMARWRHSMTDRDRARSRRSRRRPRLGWCLWRATRPRSTAIRTSCGRRGCWHAMRASTDRRRGTDVSPTWSRARCARSSAKRKSSRTRCATIWNVAMPSSSRRWRRFCAFIARSRS